MSFFLYRVLNAEEQMETSDLEYTSCDVHCLSLEYVENNKAFTINSELPCLFNKYSLNLFGVLVVYTDIKDYK